MEPFVRDLNFSGLSLSSTFSADFVEQDRPGPISTDATLLVFISFSWLEHKTTYRCTPSPRSAPGTMIIDSRPLGNAADSGVTMQSSLKGAPLFSL